MMIWIYKSVVPIELESFHLYTQMFKWGEIYALEETGHQIQ